MHSHHHNKPDSSCYRSNNRSLFCSLAAHARRGEDEKRGERAINKYLSAIDPPTPCHESRGRLRRTSPRCLACVITKAKFSKSHKNITGTEWRSGDSRAANPEIHYTNNTHHTARCKDIVASHYITLGQCDCPQYPQPEKGAARTAFTQTNGRHDGSLSAGIQEDKPGVPD